MADWKNNPTVQKALAELGRDKKKAVILGVLLMVCLVMCIRMFGGGSGTSAASASSLLTSNGSPVTAIKAVPGATDADSKAKARRDEYIKNMSGVIVRDLFATDLSVFPIKTVEPVKVSPTVQATSAPVPSEGELIRRQVLSEAHSLVLESTMLGASAIASINGKVLHIGDYLGEFQVTDITAHSCVVRKKGISLTLEIRK